MTDKTRIVAMCSIPERETGMLKVVGDLVVQCHQLYLCLNGYAPGYQHPLLDNPKIHVLRKPREMGAQGKFYMANRVAGYYLTVDDDINYPSDYVEKMVQGIEKYKYEAVVGMHGIIYCLRQDRKHPPRSIKLHYLGSVERDFPVHHIGTGTMAFHTSTFSVDWQQISPGKLDDQIGWMLQLRRLPTVVLAHPEGYLTNIPKIHHVCAYKHNKVACDMAVRRETNRRWNLYLPLSWRALPHIASQE